jgi:mono/diheme cytochrome c family protein
MTRTIVLVSGGAQHRAFVRAMVIAIALITLPGCWRENMGSQPKVKPETASSFFADGTNARMLVRGVIPRGGLLLDPQLDFGFENGKLSTTFPQHYPTEADGPFPTRGTALRAVLERGQQQFTIYCSMCHGDAGDGHGIIPARGFFPPPSYDLDRLRAAPVGHFFDVITNGYGAMYSYGDRISPADRWAIVAYIRTLELSQAIPTSVLDSTQQQQLEGAR